MYGISNKSRFFPFGAHARGTHVARGWHAGGMRVARAWNVRNKSTRVEIHDYSKILPKFMDFNSRTPVAYVPRACHVRGPQMGKIVIYLISHTSLSFKTVFCDIHISRPDIAFRGELATDRARE